MKQTSSADALIRAIRDMDDRDFGPSITGILQGDRYVAHPPLSPEIGTHPRLLLTAADLPGIRAALRRAECKAAATQFRAMCETETDGALPPATLHETGRPGKYNIDYDLLAVIQAKALDYLLSGRRERGYEAILAIKNYLRTLEIDWIHSDQCREFGWVMYNTACVYDWCYDLLTPKDKFQLTAGVEHRLCTGVTADTVHSTYGGAKMECGFPPVKEGAVSGHGSEMQILRDYLAYAVAIYDEHPGWYDYIAGRVYQDFVPVRNVYYKGGLYPQGTPSYATWRYHADTFSAWILRSAVGHNPYVPGQAEVARNFLCQETEDGNAFLTGDIYTTKFNGNMAGIALQCGYLYGDATLRAAAKYLTRDFTSFPAGVAGTSVTEFLILSSDGMNAASDRHAGLPTVAETTAPFGTMTARNTWEPGSAVVYMKIGERSTLNHDHEDHGSFSIYYKQILAPDAGLYHGYGTDHHYYFHQATVAHNALLIFDPALHDAEPVFNDAGMMVNRDRFWYSGGQRLQSETAFLNQWMHPKFEYGKVLGRAHACKSDGGADFAYLAGDVAAAYPAGVAERVERRMLAVFPDDGRIPLLFFVYDIVVAGDPSFRKTFLLQTPTEPHIDSASGTVTVTGEQSTLVMTSLIGGDRIEAVGGEGKQFFIPEAGRNLETLGHLTGRDWGRVMVKPADGHKSDVFFHAFYVKDKDEAFTPAVTEIRGDGCRGAILLDRCVMFTDGEDNLAFESAGQPLTYYISGLSAGRYYVCTEGLPVGVFTVAPEEHLVTFRCPTGKIAITKML